MNEVSDIPEHDCEVLLQLVRCCARLRLDHPGVEKVLDRVAHLWPATSIHGERRPARM
jgi:hypothetical protein